MALDRVLGKDRATGTYTDYVFGQDSKLSRGSFGKITVGESVAKYYESIGKKSDTGFLNALLVDLRGKRCCTDDIKAVLDDNDHRPDVCDTKSEHKDGEGEKAVEDKDHKPGLRDKKKEHKDTRETKDPSDDKDHKNG